MKEYECFTNTPSYVTFSTRALSITVILTLLIVPIGTSLKYTASPLIGTLRERIGDVSENGHNF